MDKKTDEKATARKPNKKLVILGVVIVAIVLLVLLITQLAAPKRSVTAYCQTYKEEKARIAKLPGNSWPSGVFNDAVGDAGEFATAFSKLENVAPEEIRGDVATLKSVYQKIDNDPSQAIGASLSGSSADTSLKNWTNSNCGSNGR
ncbi:MAG TPA: hypothetical protein VF733_03830 [Candidatus Saccharimonadales bacterium]